MISIIMDEMQYITENIVKSNDSETNKIDNILKSAEIKYSRKQGIRPSKDLFKYNGDLRKIGRTVSGKNGYDLTVKGTIYVRSSSPHLKITEFSVEPEDSESWQAGDKLEPFHNFLWKELKEHFGNGVVYEPGSHAGKDRVVGYDTMKIGYEQYVHMVSIESKDHIFV